MKLRTIIFIILLALGILPILTLVGVNLRSHINQHETVEKKRTAAGAESSFVSLNARVKCIKKSLLQAAATPASAGLDPASLDSADCQRLAGLLIGQMQTEKMILGVRLFDGSGKQRVHLRRKTSSLPPVADSLPPVADSLLEAATAEGADAPPPPPLFQKGLRLKVSEVDALLSEDQRYPGASLLSLATPIPDRDGAVAGVVVMEISPALFLDTHGNACWATPSGAIIHAPASFPQLDPDHPIASGANILGLIPALAPLMAENLPFVWENSTGLSLTWLPLIFNDHLPPPLWLGSPVDRSAAREWKLSLIYNIAGIVLCIAIVVSLIANAMAKKIDRIKDAILTGLDSILNKGEENVQFSWTGPREVVNLAEELTTLARHYAITRTKQQEAEADLRQSEDKFRNLTASAQDAIAMMDHRGNISYWNEAAAEIFGFSASEALGNPIHTLISPRLSESGQRGAMEEKPVSDGPIRETIELITKRKDGTELPIELSLSEARVKDRWNSIWIIRDITERRRAEDETKLQQQQLVQADKMISLGVLISGVAHEINNPNSIAMLNTSMLFKAWESAKPILDEYYQENGDFLIAGLQYSEMCEQIPRLFLELEESARRIKNIVHDLKDYARQDTTRHMEPVEINTIAKAAIRLNHNKIKNATRNFSTELAPDLPPIRGNRQRLEQVLINLIQNSCEALTSPEGAITITSHYNANSDEVEVCVHDEGTGIPPQIINQITDPFFTTKRSYGGTGLGLSVSAGIIKEHQGRLSFSSSPAAGTTATLSFPAWREEMGDKITQAR
ncbi:two-component system sensor histidine kinase NtrB [Thiovibrio frasassiensis]|uniref:histidine kinase n=1 Tax=Thiovibrio frasassiensis TaxID=2984131 RepID=A0A9X4MI26_9BACT|nr:ATP-binding protein [Thiovibrio frasassiensis]MDG4476260.1 PAS domain S-box protein [Thiovibrio frasassiensis]